MVQAGLLGVVAGLGGYLLLTDGPAGAGACARARPGAAGFRARRRSGLAAFRAAANAQIVAQFDKNGDKRLDNAERKAARESLAADPGPRGVGFGRRGGPGGSDAEA